MVKVTSWLPPGRSSRSTIYIVSTRSMSPSLFSCAKPPPSRSPCPSPPPHDHSQHERHRAYSMMLASSRCVLPVTVLPSHTSLLSSSWPRFMHPCYLLSTLTLCQLLSTLAKNPQQNKNSTQSLACCVCRQGGKRHEAAPPLPPIVDLCLYRARWGNNPAATCSTWPVADDRRLVEPRITPKP